MKTAAAFCLLAAITANAGQKPSVWTVEPISSPAESWAFDYESGVLWRVTDETTADYVVLPQMLSLRTPEHFSFEFAGGELTLRSRFTLLIEPILEGPEDIYLGWSGSPSIEYWCPTRHACIFLSAGGGFGWINSGNEPGGQGQDFTFNWFASGGLRYYVRPNLALSAGVMFQHWSNRGATDPNPGLDALGPILGLTWHF